MLLLLALCSSYRLISRSTLFVCSLPEALSVCCFNPTPNHPQVSCKCTSGFRTANGESVETISTSSKQQREDPACPQRKHSISSLVSKAHQRRSLYQPQLFFSFESTGKWTKRYHGSIVIASLTGAVVDPYRLSHKPPISARQFTLPTQLDLIASSQGQLDIYPGCSNTYQREIKFNYIRHECPLELVVI